MFQIKIRMFVIALILAGCSDQNRTSSTVKATGIESSVQHVWGGKLATDPRDPAEPNWVDYAVGLMIGIDGTNPFCSGSLINPKLVVTSAHCFDGISPSKHTQSVDIRFGPDIYNPTSTRTAKKVIIHPDYIKHTNLKNNFEAKQYDIALILLDKDAPSNMKTLHVDAALYQEGSISNLIGLGYGATHGRMEIKPHELGKLRVANKLKADLDQIYYGFIQTEKFEGQGMCQGDSGGPIIFYDKDNDAYYLAGVFSSARGDLTKEQENRVLEMGVDQFHKENPNFDFCSLRGIFASGQYHAYWILGEAEKLGLKVEE